jgi:hypothetical protein
VYPITIKGYLLKWGILYARLVSAWARRLVRMISWYFILVNHE